MTESNLSIDFNTLQRDIGRLLGFGRDPSCDWDDDQRTDADDIIAEGLRKFYTAHTWSFLKPTTTFVTSAPYSTGTITIASGVVTLSGGTFPSWAADGELTYDGGGTYTVGTYTSGTSITLDDTSVTAAAGTTYTLTRPTYSLPDDFGFLLESLTYRPGTSNGIVIELRSPQQIMHMRQQSELTGRPKFVAVRPKAKQSTVGSRQELLWWPVPDADYTFTGRYSVLPNKLTASNKYPYGGMYHSETIKASVLAAAERMHAESSTAWREEFNRLLPISVAFDNRQSAPDRLGMNIDRSDELYDHRRHHLNDGHYVTFEGQNRFSF